MKRSFCVLPMIAATAFGFVSCSDENSSPSANVNHFQGNTDEARLKSDFPFAAKLLDDKGQPYCSGVVVARNLVMTAAHCMRDIRKNQAYDVSQMKVVTVLGHRRNVKSGNSYEYTSVNFFAHGMDVGYLLLDEDLPFSQPVAAIATPEDLQNTKSAAGRIDLVSVGIGKTEGHDRAVGGTFNFLDLEFVGSFGPLRNRESLEIVKGQTESSEHGISEFMAGGFGYTICNADSGGGAFVKVKEGTKAVHKVVGIASRTIGYNRSQCGDDLTGIYTYAHFAKDWIEKDSGIQL